MVLYSEDLDKITCTYPFSCLLKEKCLLDYAMHQLLSKGICCPYSHIVLKTSLRYLGITS